MSYKGGSSEFTIVLGADDPEARAAGRLCSVNGVPVAVALFGGDRVDFGTAYKANNIGNHPGHPNVLPIIGDIVTFEANVPGRLAAQVIKRIDHHKPGDAGYDKLASEYMTGSSLGQLAAHIGVGLNEKQRVIAALDHCAPAAMSGEIDDIDPTLALHTYLEGVHESHPRVTPANVVGAYWDALHVLNKTRNVVQINGQEVLDLRDRHLGPSTSLRRLMILAALATSGNAGLTLCRDPLSNWSKVMLNGHVEPSTVEDFKSKWGPEQGYVGIFGSPPRQYAGGLMPSSLELHA